MLNLEITKTEVLPNHNDLVEGAYETYVYYFKFYDNKVLILENKAFIGVTYLFLVEWNRRFRLGQVKQSLVEKIESYLLPFVKAHFKDFNDSTFKRTLLIKSKEI